jgi:hypothetical protein
MTWFTELTSCSESSPAQVRNDLRVTGPYLISLKSGQRWQWGTLNIPTLAQLREQVQAIKHKSSKLTLSEVVGDVQKLHVDARHANATFQVASQFNLLEMMSPDVSPERGIGIYERDHTQGPACAIACGAGTIYRHYFVPIDSDFGQSEERQIDCLDHIARFFRNAERRLWKMQNGYMLPTLEGLNIIATELRQLTTNRIDELRSLLRVGIQSNTQVTLNACQHTVHQVYCSALPVAYTTLPDEAWEPLARLTLEAAYEATFSAAVLNAEACGNHDLFLTLLGGGAFGNRLEWIMDAIERSIDLFSLSGLKVSIVSHGRSKLKVRELVDKYAKT